MSKSLVEENRELKQQIKALKDQVNKLTAIIKLQQNQMFGEKTEVIESVVDGQQSLFSDDELAQLQDSNVSITEVIEKQTKQGASPESQVFWSADRFFGWFTSSG